MTDARRNAVLLLAGVVTVILLAGGILSTPTATAMAIGLIATIGALFLTPRRHINTVVFAIGATLIAAVPSMEFSGITRVGISVVPGALMLIGYLRSEIRAPLNRTAWIVLVWLLLLAVGINSMEDALKFLGYAVLALAGVLIGSRLSRNVVTTTLTALSTVEVLIGVAQVFLGARLPWQYDDATARTNELFGGSFDRAEGSLGHPLVLSFFIAVTFALVLRSHVRPVMRAPILAWLAFGMVLTGSRSGILLLIALVLISARRRLTIARAVHVTGALATATIVGVLTGFFHSQLVTRLISSGSVYHRTSSVASFASLFTLGPRAIFIGGGYSGVSKAQAKGLLLADSFGAIDNQFVSLMATVGLIGLCLFVALIVTAFLQSSPRIRWAVSSAVAMFFIFDVLDWTSSMFLLMVMLGLALARPLHTDVQVANPREHHTLPGPSRHPVKHVLAKKKVPSSPYTPAVVHPRHTPH